MQLGANYGSFYNSFDQENQSPAAGHHPLHNCIQFMSLQQQNSSSHHHHHQHHHHQEENYLSFSVSETTTIKMMMMMRMIMQEMIKCCCMDSRPKKVRKNASFCFIAMSFCWELYFYVQTLDAPLLGMHFTSVCKPQNAPMFQSVCISFSRL